MGQLEGLEFDTDAMTENLGKYIDAALGAMPEGKEGEEVSGDIEGYDYTSTTKTYTITGKDFANMLKAVLEEAKNDENLKSLYEQIGAYATGTATGTVPNMSYEELIDQVLASMGEVEEGRRERKLRRLLQPGYPCRSPLRYGRRRAGYQERSHRCCNSC